MNIVKIKENTFSIVVPSGIRYISNWKDFELFDYPHILDKQIPGCGFTEFCLTNNQNLILCSPRKLLLENKYDQHKDEIYYVINEFEHSLGIDIDTTKPHRERAVYNKSTIETEDDLAERKKKYYEWLKSDIEKYINGRLSSNLPFKIIVTYDSFYLVDGIMKEINITSSLYTRNEIQIVVDEFQSIFTDSAFKSSTENEFIDVLMGLRRICFVSATPMIEEYLRQVDIFKDIPYYELDWASEDYARVKKPTLKVKLTRSVMTTAKDIITSYLLGNFESRYTVINGSVVSVQSKEAVLFFNSVNNILSIIKKIGLKPEQVNILCANTPENAAKIRKKLGRKYFIGSVPLKGEPHKMFTFCTRTVYLGADFYSTCARSFILSDANIETLAVDISLDLPQILGRQRLRENPWKNEAEFYYKPICKNNTKSEEEFKKHLDKKMDYTTDLLSVYDNSSDKQKVSLTEAYEALVEATFYKSGYVAVNKIQVSPGVFIKKPVLNRLVRISEERAFDIQQRDYADRFSVFSSIESNNITSAYQQEVADFFNAFESLSTLTSKLKFYCEYPCTDEVKTIILNQITEKHFHEYIETLGISGIRAAGYNIGSINKKLRIVSFSRNDLVARIYTEFQSGTKYSLQYIKDTLFTVYTETGYEKSPVASDLEEYFETKRIKMKDDTGKWVNGFELIKKKKC